MANIYGYIRVSTKDQNEQRQLHKMMERGVEARRIFVDKASGRHFDRPQYQLLRKILSTGDIVYIDALDRMGRNYDEVISEWKYITRESQADIVVLENETLFDSRKFREMGDMGRLMEDQFLSLLSYVADQERKKMLPGKGSPLCFPILIFRLCLSGRCLLKNHLLLCVNRKSGYILALAQ